MKIFAFCYHWNTYGGTGYVEAESAEQAVAIIQEKYPQFNEDVEERRFWNSIPINRRAA